MSRMRSFSFPRINTSKSADGSMPSSPMSPYQSWTAHSRDSSNGSSNSSPITPTFSARGGHNRYPSSTSSLVSNTDSSANPQKSMLHDLVEDPSERDDLQHSDDVPREPMCICDTPFCEHTNREPSFDETLQLTTPEWTPGDDYFDDGHLPGEPIAKRRRNEEQPIDRFTSRLSRHFSKHFGHRSSTSTSTSMINLRSAPTSRPSSLRLPATRSFTAPNAHEMRNTSAPAFPVAPLTPQARSVSPPGTRPRATSQLAPKPIEISISEAAEDPTDRQELASTPLLPPMMAEYFNDSQEAMRSPLQSPTVASPSTVPSMVGTPASTPVLPGFPTPPLSTKHSMGSINMRSSNILLPASEIPHLAITEETDKWAIKLGHANFHINPEPYLPDVCDAQTCRQLRDDWEIARVEYMKQAARVSEHYGVTSQIYKLTEDKWAEIDAKWRKNHEWANAAAQAMGENTLFQPLAETQALKKMPSLQDPQQPSKFPAVEDADIVGPMVQYAKIQQRRQTPSKRPSFLKIFTDPSSLLGRQGLTSRW